MRVSILLVVAVAAVCFGSFTETAQAYPCTGDAYYVDGNTGSDGNSGCSGSPWATLQFAMDSANAGDTVYVADDTYTTSPSGNPVIDCDGAADSGSSGSPITFRPDGGWDWGDPPAGVELTSTADGVVRFDGCDYVEIHGFKVIGPSTNISGTNIAVTGGASHDAFTDGEVTGSSCQGIYTSGTSDNFTVSRNHIHHNGSSGVGGCLHSNGVTSIQSHGIYLEGDEHQVDNNYIERNGHGFGIQFYDEGYGSFVTQNTLAYNGGIRQCCGGATIGGSNLDAPVFVNNVLAHNWGRGLRMNSGLSASDCTVAYNTFYDNGGNNNRPPARTDNWDSAWTTFTPCFESNNAVADPGLVTDPWPMTSSYNWSTVDALTIDPHLDGSYKDNASAGFSFSYDQEYYVRCSGEGFDRGAYEYHEEQGEGCLS